MAAMAAMLCCRRRERTPGFPDRAAPAGAAHRLSDHPARPDRVRHDPAVPDLLRPGVPGDAAPDRSALLLLQPDPASLRAAAGAPLGPARPAPRAARLDRRQRGLLPHLRARPPRPPRAC